MRPFPALFPHGLHYLIPHSLYLARQQGWRLYNERRENGNKKEGGYHEGGFSRREVFANSILKGTGKQASKQTCTSWSIE